MYRPGQVYDGPFTEQELEHLRKGECPVCFEPMVGHNGLAYCTDGLGWDALEDEELLDCKFRVSQAYVRGWIGSNPWAVELKPLRKKV